MHNFLIIANDEYVRFAKSLIHSIHRYVGDFKIFLYIINPHRKSLRELEKKADLYHLEIRPVISPLDKKIWDIDRKPYSDEAAFSANIRGKILSELIRELEVDNLTYIDADSFFMKPLERQLCPLNVDLTFFKRAEDYCSSGLLSFNLTPDNKPRILEFVDYFAERINFHGLLKWFSDQTALKDCYRKFILSGHLKYHCLDVEYFDWRCNPESVIWLGKGKRRRDSFEIYIESQELNQKSFELNIRKMKNIIYYIRRKRDAYISSLNEAGIAGLRAQGVDFEIKYEDEYEPSEIAVLFGYHKAVSKAGRKRKELYDLQDKLGKKVMILERGFIKRDLYHSIGWGGINGRANFNNLHRPTDRLALLNLDVKPWKAEGKTILIAGQVPWDAAVQHINDGTKKGTDAIQGYLNWLRDVVSTLEIRTPDEREIVFRPHPLFSRPEYYREALPEYIRWSDKSLEEDLADAWACFALNSNTLVDGIIEGVHPFAYDAGSVIYQYANKNLKNLRKPIRFDRVQVLADLAYAQWTLEEIAQGLYWKALNEQRGN